MYCKNEYKNRFRILKGGLISLVVASNLYGAPTGGTVVSGNATISQNANTTNINQSSNKAIINWQDFSIKSNETVNFNQPNVNSITLNRVIGNEKSIIDGALNANGQVWLVNSNGVLFGKNAKVNTAGIVASTKDISNEDFNKGNYNFKGDSKASIVNEGEIKSLANTHATFIANSVTNKGKIEVHKGTINLIGASDVTLTLNENQNLSLKVNKGVLDALVDNQNLIVANGGNVYLTTNAKNELLKGVVNHSGIIEANSLDELTQSEVILFAHGGTTNVDGSIIAKNSFVETSGEKLNVTSNTKVIAKDWLLDPTDILIESTGGSVLTGDSVSATAIQNNLETTNVHLQATNNITVNQNITWSTDKQLKLEANNINVNATINNTNQTNGGVYFQAANTTDKVVFDTNGKVVVNNVYQLQWINTALAGKYELGSNIDASATTTWNSGAGFNPLGDYTNNFNGRFDGLGHTISDLYINRNSTKYVGLFGYINNSSTVKNIGLTNVDITGNLYEGYVGGLAGENNGLIQNSYSSGSVNGNEQVGGLVGRNWGGGRVQNSYASGSVTGFNEVGGLVGRSEGSTIENSYSNGSVNGDYSIGGLVGYNEYGIISNSYATGNVTGQNGVGGLVGYNYLGIISNSYASGNVAGSHYVGGLVGYNHGTISDSFYDEETNTASMDDSSYGKTKAEILSLFSNLTGWGTNGAGASVEGYEIVLLPYLIGVTKDEDKSKSILFSGGFGTSANPYTITNWTQLQNINNSNILTQNYYFNLLNNLSSSTSDYTNLASNTANSGLGWNPIGDYTNNFNGRFDGLGFTISNLFINRPTQDYVGLFGYTNNATIKNIGLKDVDIRGYYYVGGLVGVNDNGTISNSYATGSVNGDYSIGGLVGVNDNGTISNSYATGSVNGFNEVGGLVGWNYEGTITNSFYDKTKYTGDGVGNNSTHPGVTGKTTQEMSYGETFKNASWDIVADSSVTSLTPVIKWDSINNKYVWAISPIALTYTLSDKTTTYDGTTQTLSSFYTSNPFTIPTGYEFLNLTSADYKFQVDGSDVTGYKDAGTYSNIKVASNNEFLAIASSGNTDGKLTINKKDLTISNITANNKTYDGTTTATLSNSGTLVGLVTGEDLVLNPTSVIFSSKDVGDNINVTASGYTIADKDSFKASNYNLLDTSKTTTANISKADLTATLNDNSKTYDGTSYSGGNGITFNGFVNGETASLLGGNLVYSGTSQGAKDAGNYIISGSGLTSNNYNISFVDGKLTINKKDLTISNITANNKTYDGTTTATLSNSGTLVGLVTGEDLVLNPTSVIFSSKDVGDNINVTASGYTIADKDSFKASNYNLLDTSKTTTANISKADLTATLNDNSKTYDGTSYSGGNGITFNGFVNGETASLLGGNLVYSGTSQGAKDAGNYIISGSGLTSNNYNISFVDGKLTINKKDLTISNITANNKTYDGTTTATLSNSGTLVGLVTGEDLVLNPTSVIFSSKDVGDNINVTASGYTIADKDSFKASNYNLLDTSKTTTANISKADLTATLNDNSKTYDGTSYSGGNGITFNGFVNGETASLLGGNLVYSGTSQGAKDAGNYIISGSGLTSNNYNISFVDGKLTINKKDLTISNITANNKTYDGTTTATLSNSGTLVGLVTGEDLVLNPTSVIFSSKDVGDNINVTASGYTIADKDSFKASNYNLLDTSKTTTANISKADLTATLNDNSKTYDGTSYSGGNGITFNGFVNGETASLLGGNLVYSGTSQGAKDAGNYIISGSGLTSNNYNISFVDGKLTINKKDLTISNITANNKTYDGTTTATLSNSGTLVGLVTGEDLVLNPTSVIFSSKDVGDNINVTASGYTIADKDSFKASNYNLLDTSKTTTANIVASVNPTPKVDENVQRVVASIEASTNSNSNSSSNQSLPNSLNSNIRTLSFNGVDEIRVINGGVKMPENIANEVDIIK